MKTNGPVKVLIVHGVGLMRIGIETMLHLSDPGIEIVGHAAGGREAIMLAEKLSPDVIVSDLRLPTLSGLVLARGLDHVPSVRGVILLHSEWYDQCLHAALYTGVRGCFIDREPVELLAAGIRKVAQGTCSFAPTLEARALMIRLRANTGHPRWLSPNELIIALWSCDGYSAREIATILGLSVTTVETHKTSVRRKLDIPADDLLSCRMLSSLQAPQVSTDSHAFCLESAS